MAVSWSGAKKGDCVLDLCCGSGDFAFILSEKVGIDGKYLSTSDFAMREELSLKAAILAEKFAPDLSWYVDVILQLIDKAGDFVSDDIWFRVVQFVTNNEDLQPYAALKAKEYLDKPAIHETMVKVSAYLLGEFGHLLARRPGCSAKELFSLIHDKLPTVSVFLMANDVLRILADILDGGCDVG